MKKCFLAVFVMTLFIIPYSFIGSGVSCSHAYDVTVKNISPTETIIVSVHCRKSAAGEGTRQCGIEHLPPYESHVFKMPGCLGALRAQGLYPGIWVGCMGVKNDCNQTCCWDTRWEVTWDGSSYVFIKK